jgi:hypothetical protein
MGPVNGSGPSGQRNEPESRSDASTPHYPTLGELAVMRQRLVPPHYPTSAELDALRQRLRRDPGQVPAVDREQPPASVSAVHVASAGEQPDLETLEAERLLLEAEPVDTHVGTAGMDNGSLASTFDADAPVTRAGHEDAEDGLRSRESRRCRRSQRRRDYRRGVRCRWRL